jgi:hypothetical protein
MSLYFRLLLMFLRAPRRPRISLAEESRSRHIVLPQDLDVMLHMNKGRYFTVTDYARIEMFIRCRLWRRMRARRLAPITAGETIQFRSPADSKFKCPFGFVCQRHNI